MKEQDKNFKLIKENPQSENRNYIFQNNKVTKVAFFIIVACLLIGVTMIFTFNEQ